MHSMLGTCPMRGPHTRCNATHKQQRGWGHYAPTTGAASLVLWVFSSARHVSDCGVVCQAVGSRRRYIYTQAVGSSTASVLLHHYQAPLEMCVLSKCADPVAEGLARLSVCHGYMLHDMLNDRSANCVTSAIARHVHHTILADAAADTVKCCGWCSAMPGLLFQRCCSTRWTTAPALMGCLMCIGIAGMAVAACWRLASLLQSTFRSDVLPVIPKTQQAGWLHDSSLRLECSRLLHHLSGHGCMGGRRLCTHAHGLHGWKQHLAARALGCIISCCSTMSVPGAFEALG